MPWHDIIIFLYSMLIIRNAGQLDTETCTLYYIFSDR